MIRYIVELSVATRIAFQDLVELDEETLATYAAVIERNNRKR